MPVTDLIKVQIGPETATGWGTCVAAKDKLLGVTDAISTSWMRSIR